MRCLADVLPVQVRLQLSELLAAPGQPPAIFPRQLTKSALPVTPDARAEIRRAIEAGLAAEAVGKLALHRLGAVVPALARCAPDAVARFAPSRVRVLLARHSTTLIERLTIGEICDWRGVGPTRVAQLIGAAVGAASEFLAAEQILPILTDPTPGSLSPLFTAALAAAGDHRDRGVFENGVLPLGPPVTWPELAAALGISIDRVRRLAARAAERVRAAPYQLPIAALAAAVAERLGAAAPGAAVDEVLSSLGLPALPDPRSRLLLWTAGPYRQVAGHPGWVAVDPAGLVGQTRRLIHEDGGVRPVDHVAKDLHFEGIVAEHVESWLARQPVRIDAGLVVATTGRPGDVAERALHAPGRARTVDEIASWVDGVPRGFEELMSVPDRRFVVTRGQALALVEWGDPERAA